MKKHALFAAAAFLGVWAAVPPASAAERGEEKRHEWGMTHHHKGTVTAVDASAGMLTVKDQRGREKDFTIGSNVKIETESGKTGVLADIKPGDRVSVSYKGKEHVKEVDILRLHKK